MINSSLAVSGILLAGILTGCGTYHEVLPGTIDTSCTSRTAQIGVLDGSMKTLCGCAEPTNVSVQPPATLTCTVPAGTLVIFIYLATVLPHQIVPADGTGFPASPLSDPSQDSSTVRAHPVSFPTPGTFRYIDMLNSGLTGSIVVQ